MSHTPLELSAVVNKFDREAAQIEDVFSRNDEPSKIDGYRFPYCPLDDGCVVAIWDAWNRFLRELLLTSCGFQVIGVSGSAYLPTRIRPEKDALDALALASKSRQNRIRVTRGEPHWFDQIAIIDMVELLQLGNRTEISSAVTSSQISIGSGISLINPIGEIREIRNFIAHKNEVTHRSIQKYLTSAHIGISDYLHDTQVGGLSRFSEWVDGLRAVASAAAD